MIDILLIAREHYTAKAQHCETVGCVAIELLALKLLIKYWLVQWHVYILSLTWQERPALLITDYLYVFKLGANIKLAIEKRDVTLGLFKNSEYYLKSAWFSLIGENTLDMTI